MIHRFIGGVSLSIVAATLLFGGLLYAQQQRGGTQDGMMGMRMSMMQSCPMMASMGEGPQAALELRDELDLTEQQAQRLEVLRDEAGEARSAAMEQMRAAHEEIAEAAQVEPFDHEALRAGYDRMGEAHAEMGVTLARTAQEVRSILTDEQLERLREAGPGMCGMMPGVMQMMRACPMMGGMMGQGEMDRCPMMRGMMGGGDMDQCPMMQGADDEAAPLEDRH